MSLIQLLPFIEAFLGRGNGDFLLSHDIEDIITVIDGRPELATEIGNAEDEVRSFIQTRIAEFVTLVARLRRQQARQSLASARAGAGK